MQVVLFLLLVIPEAGSLCSPSQAEGLVQGQKGLKGCGNQSLEHSPGQSPSNFICENLPEAGPGVRALIMNTRQKQVLLCLRGPEGRQQPPQASESPGGSSQEKGQLWASALPQYKSHGVSEP